MDNRREKTEQLIRDTYTSFAIQHGADNISVKWLCEKCGINRCTFYDHYSYLDNLIDDVLAREIQRICNKVDDPFFQNADPSSGIPKQQILNYINELSNSKVIFCLLASKNASLIKQRIISIQTEITLRNMAKDDSAYYRAYFQNIGAISTILHWMEKGRTLPMEKLIDIINSFSVKMYLPHGLSE